MFIGGRFPTAATTTHASHKIFKIKFFFLQIVGLIFLSLSYYNLLSYLINNRLRIYFRIIPVALLFFSFLF